MILNSDKFQAIAVKRNHQILDSDPFHVMNEKINSKASAKLLGNDTGSKLTFDNHISTLCRKALFQ